MTVTPATRRIELRGPLDLARTLAPLVHGRGDRTIQLSGGEAWLAIRTPGGPASVRLVHRSAGVVEATAWGSGAEQALESAPRIVGETDRPEEFEAHHPILRELQRRHPGLRLPSTSRVFHALVPSVMEQKITGTEAFRVYGSLLRRYGEPAPGPTHLVLQPAPDMLAGMPYHAFHPLGLERRRAEVIRRAASRAAWLDAATSSADAQARLRSLPGIGQWTAAEVVRSSFGDPDAVSVGDYHIPSSVAWALAGEPRGGDARMLELLEPYRGQRGRVQRYLEVGRVIAPRRGPRMAPRRIEAI